MAYDPILGNPDRLRAVLSELGITVLHQVSVTLTDAQIRALQTTPVTLVPATETTNYVGTPTTLPIVVSAVFLPNVVTAYTGDGQVFITLDTVGDVALTAPVNFSTLFQSEPSYFMSVSTPIMLVNGGFINGSQLSILNGGVMDNGLSVWAEGNPTGGDPANTLRVSVTYLRFNTVTGLFE